MKWIGQHIWGLISRFRNDVYLENVADGTVASDKFLGLSEFYPAVLASSPPKEKKVSTSASSVADTPTIQDGLDKEIVIDSPDFFETDYGISEELQRELLEAEARLKQPTISVDN